MGAHAYTAMHGDGGAEGGAEGGAQRGVLGPAGLGWASMWASVVFDLTTDYP